MKNQVLYTVWCYISGEAAGKIWSWSLLGLRGFTFSWHPVSWHGSKLYKYCNFRQGPDLDLTRLRCVGLTWILDVSSKFWIFGYFGKDNRRFYARQALWSRGALWGHVCASRTCCIRVLIRFTFSNPRSCTCWGVMSHEMWNLRTWARPETRSTSGMTCPPAPNPLPLYSLVCLFVCSFVCWFCLPDPALPQEITVAASSVSSFLLSGSLHLLVCLFVCWLVGVSTKCSDEVMDAVKDRYVADASSVSPSSLWRRANDWNVSYCLLHGVFYPHQHSVDTPVCLPPHRRSYLVL